MFYHSLFLLGTVTQDRRYTENDPENLQGDSPASESGTFKRKCCIIAEHTPKPGRQCRCVFACEWMSGTITRVCRHDGVGGSTVSETLCLCRHTAAAPGSFNRKEEQFIMSLAVNKHHDLSMHVRSCEHAQGADGSASNRKASVITCISGDTLSLERTFMQLWSQHLLKNASSESEG